MKRPAGVGVGEPNVTGRSIGNSITGSGNDDCGKGGKSHEFDLIGSAVNASVTLVFVETFYRVYSCIESEDLRSKITEFRYIAGFTFFIAYISCLLSGFSGVKQWAWAQSSWFRTCMTILHASDGVSAFVIGAAMYYENHTLFILAILAITKFSMLSALNRMILGRKADGLFDELQATSKSYLHHLGSFFFLSSPEEIILTTIWRSIGMSGHAFLGLREVISESNVNMMNWVVSYLRILFTIALFAICQRNEKIRMAFGYSAIGHISYMAVRFAPVFKLGSIYMSNEDKKKWHSLADIDRLRILCSGRHIWLSVELALLLVLMTYFGYLRLTILFGSY